MAKKKETPETLPKGLLRALADRPQTLDSQELLAELTRVWGGAGKLALDIHQEFKNSTPGGMTRQRILEMMQRLIITNTERELGNVVRPADMTTDDLQRVARSLLERIPDAGPTQA